MLYCNTATVAATRRAGAGRRLGRRWARSWARRARAERGPALEAAGGAGAGRAGQARGARSWQAGKRRRGARRGRTRESAAVRCKSAG